MVHLLPILVTLAAGAAAQNHDYSAHSQASNQSLLWGAYRPNLYFGLRPRLPNSLLTGMMWFGAHDYQSYTSAFRARARCATCSS